MFGRKKEFQLGAVSHQHLLSRGQLIGTAAVHYALAQGAGSEEGQFYHLGQSAKSGFKSAMINANTQATPTGKMKYKAKNRTPITKVDQN
jgi:hypothetical protein